MNRLMVALCVASIAQGAIAQSSAKEAASKGPSPTYWNMGDYPTAPGGYGLKGPPNKSKDVSKTTPAEKNKMLKELNRKMVVPENPAGSTTP